MCEKKRKGVGVKSVSRVIAVLLFPAVLVITVLIGFPTVFQILDGNVQVKLSKGKKFAIFFLN